MALPNRLWLPDGGHDLPTWIAETRLASEPLLPTEKRWRRRAVLAGTDSQPERTVLVEWFAQSELRAAQIAPLRGLCHVHVLRLHQVGKADARTAFALSEAPLGIDLLAICKTATAKLPVWWAVCVIRDAARGLWALHKQLEDRGHHVGLGTVDASCIFVSTTGRVQVLAFAPLARPLLVDDPIAPEVRQSHRLCSPAADVYSLATVLSMLPIERPLPEALLRVLARCRSPHAEKRPTLSLLLSQLDETLGGLGAPLPQVERIGAELHRLIPAARSRDLSDGEWGSAGPVTFGPLPKTLSPLAATAVSLSATWDAAPPLDLAPMPRRPAGWMIGIGLFATTMLGSGLAALLPSAAPPTHPPVQATAQLAKTNGPHLPTTLPLREGVRGQLGGLRVQILKSELSTGSLHVILLLTNPDQQPHRFEPLSLRVSASPDSQSYAPEPLPVMELSPGQLQTLALRFLVPSSMAGLQLWQQR